MPDPVLQVVFQSVDRGISQDIRALNGQLDVVDGHARKASGGMSSLIGVVGGLTATLGATGLVAAVGKAGFEFDNFKQQSTIAFETLLGSADAAKAHMADLTKLAATTPFAMKDVVQGSQRLQAMGIAAKDVVPTLTAIGDAVAGLGGDAGTLDRVTVAIGQMKAKGKASSEEMMQLTEAGIGAWEMLAKKIGTDVPTAMDKVSKGAISSDTAISAVIEGMNAKFGGMMEKQSHTFGGLLSTLQDTFSQVSGTVMAPFFDMATKGMERLAAVTSTPEFAAGVQRFAAGLADLAAKGLALATQVGPPLVAMVTQFAGVVQAAVPVVQSLWERFGEGHEKLVAAGAAVGALVLALGAVPVAIAAVAVGVKLLIDHWDEITQKVPLLGTAFDAAKDAVTDAIDFIRDQFDRLRGWWEENGQDISAAAGRVMDGVRVVIDTAVTAIKALWDRFGESIVTIVRTRWDEAKTIIKLAVDLIGGIIRTVVDLINGDWSKAWDDVKGIFKDVGQAAKRLVEDEFTILQTVLGEVGGLVKDVGGWFKDKLAAGLDQVTGAIGRIMGPLQGLLDKLSGAGAVLDKLGNLIPHSPAPLAVGLGQVADAANRAASGMANYAHAAAAAVAPFVPTGQPGTPTSGGGIYGTNTVVPPTAQQGWGNASDKAMGEWEQAVSLGRLGQGGNPYGGVSKALTDGVAKQQQQLTVLERIEVLLTIIAEGVSGDALSTKIQKQMSGRFNGLLAGAL